MEDLLRLAAAYACSALTLGMLGRMAVHNRKSGWRRQRHPHCYVWRPAEAGHLRPAPAPPPPAPHEFAFTTSLLELSRRAAESPGVSPQPTPAQDQKRECPASLSTASK
jgi:hypothetical protein